MQLALILFGLTYAALLLFPKIRTYAALCSAALFVVLGIMPVEKVLSSIDWNVILMIAGTMGLVSLFIESKMPALLADLIIEKTPNVKWAIVFLALFAGLISAFVDNVATVLMVAPVALVIAKRLNVSPVPMVISIAIASNLQGAATLVGDTTSILLGGYADMDFLDFFYFNGHIGIFWVVQVGAVAATLVLVYLFRKEDDLISVSARTKVTDYFPTFLLVGAVALLILASFLPSKPAETNGIICISLFVVGMIRNFIKTQDVRAIVKPMKEIDYQTLLLLAGLFVVIGSLTEAGVLDEIARLFVELGGDNPFVMYTIIVWVSVICSAFVDNIPYVATMLPVVSGVSELMGTSPYILYFGLLIGATLGGNLTPIGASANISALGILRKNGHQVKTGQFMKISVPFTLAAVITGYALIWFIWSG